MTGSVSGFLTSCVNVVESTGSSVALMPRFVFHWFWNHSSLVLFLALEEYVSLRLASAAVAAGLACASAALGAGPADFLDGAPPAQPGVPGGVNAGARVSGFCTAG